MNKIAWIVDVQNDFMRPPQQGGRLYVANLFDASDPGAREVIPALERAVRWAQRRCEAVVYTGDWHGYDDPEIDPVSADAARGTYPPHCMGRSPDPAEREGAEIIAEIRPSLPVTLAPDASVDGAILAAGAALRAGTPVVLHKTRFDVFEGSTAAEPLLAEMARMAGERGVEIYVFGVARDVCVTQAVDGMRRLGYPVVAVHDTMWGLGLEAEEETFARWTAAGVRLATLDQIGA
jgi:nicotinamidase-related amidase